MVFLMIFKENDMFYFLFVLYLFLTSMGLLFIKLGGKSTTITIAHSIFSIQIDLKLFFGLLCYVFSFLLYTVILQKRDLSYIYPISAGILNVITVLIGVVILKEKITASGIIGVAAIILGVVLLNVKG